MAVFDNGSQAQQEGEDVQPIVDKPIADNPVVLHRSPMLEILWLGLQPYEPIWQAMRRTARLTLANPSAPNRLWLLHHEPVYTLGTRGLKTGLVGQLRAPVVKTDRGGDVTYHGPGQLVGYPILRLSQVHLSGPGLVHGLESCLIRLLGDWNIEAVADANRPGVYVKERKIASIGLRLRRLEKQQVSYHGFALNVAMELAPFLQINPCGYAGQSVTDLRQLWLERADASPTGAAPTIETVAEVFATLFLDWFQSRLSA